MIFLSIWNRLSNLTTPTVTAASLVTETSPRTLESSEIPHMNYITNLRRQIHFLP